ncbi:iron complex outermembrane recepter protein [Sphingomonas jatrophae]|uniref:Iron complex outermembrane recepter protein n=2 Tax=Sphingomonas jatrophae TaxID=1166337 RepID=A0A1I6M053_9SPHN|nr:iron complex outermembrane recepter protein [Sphingomonas jatrophae]
MRFRCALLACSATAAMLPTVALAQADTATPGTTVTSNTSAQPTGGIQDIVVTARRTEERLQNVPVAVTGFSALQVQALGITNFGDIAKGIPNLEAQRQFGSASSPQFYLRGVATGTLKFEADAGIGLYIDGVYLGRPAGAAFDLADIQRVEVLRGPQATLFGRNSTGGAINYITSSPRGELGVRVDGTLANYDRRKGKISIDLPALGPLSARISYLHDEFDGFVRNLTPSRSFQFTEPFGTIRSAKSFGGENTDAVTAALRLDLAALVVDYKFDYTNKVSTQLGQQLLGFNPTFAPTGSLIVNTPGAVVVGPSTRRQKALALDFTTPSHLKIQGHSVTAKYEMTDDVSVKSITGFRKLDENVGGNDIDGGALVDPFTGSGAPFTYISSVEDRHQKQFSQELQLLGRISSLDFVLGGFFFRETGRDNNPVFVGSLLPTSGVITPSTGPGTGSTINLFGVPSDYLAGSNVTVRNRSVAGYGHLAYKAQRFELAGGIRYSKDNRRENLLAAGLVPFVTPSQVYKVTNDHWDFDATSTFIFNPNVRAYARFATGYISGGVLGGIAFKSETIKSYEVGFKGDFLDRTVRLNLAAFHSDRRNVQTLSFSAASGTFIVSSPKASENGLEVEATLAPTGGLTFTGSFGYLDASLADDPVSGAPVRSLAPRYTAGVSGQYEFPKFGNESFVTARVDGFFKGKRASDPLVNASTQALTELPSRFDVNARISLVDLPIGGTKVRVSAWAQNLTYNKKLEFARDLSTAVIGVFQVPRTYGIDLGFAF